MNLMEQFDFDELEVRDDAKRLHLVRRPRNQPQQMAPAVVVPGMVGAAAPIAAAAAGEPGAEALPADVEVITSPMVGTFYSASSPDASPFVSDGEEVKEEQVLCIIEAMKVMNEIKAECTGTVLKVLVANGEAVEYGEPLFHIRRDS
ncbi:MAG: acetyl-CoA carboxylase biotin carboxyl carrier protein [Planctomycetes bacterium]|nr:acetyl-CoA carboxylase biotin carboxyl carrier protein [Planctomycetota bacterium]